MILDDFLAFSREQVRSGDIDPVYPVLRAILAARAPGDANRGLWLTALYVAYYDLGSALVAWRARSEPAPLPAALLRLPTGIERRGLREPAKLRAHLAGWLAATGGDLAGWLGRGLDADPRANFARLWARLVALPFNGRWAAFKWLDLLAHAHDWPIAFPDLRLADCSGPLAGLHLVAGARATESLALLNARAARLRGRCAAAGLPLAWEELETCLCDFHSLAAGRYYPGRDIDELQAALDRAPLHPDDRDLLARARRASFPPEYLGEFGGWSGVDRARARRYRDTGIIPLRGEVDHARIA